MAITLSPIAELLPYILPAVPQVPRPFAEFKARKAVIEFCERTRCWRQIVTVNVTANNAMIIAPPNSTIHEFEEATLNGRELTPTQFTELAVVELTGMEDSAQAKYVTQIAPGQVAVWPFETGVLRVSCFLKPRHGQSIGGDPDNPLADDYNVLPSFMVAQYATALAAGALSRIFETRGQSFYDPALAGKHRAEFEQACDRHFGSNMRGQQRAPIRVKPRWI